MKTTPLILEALEDRIAPASMITYTDVDGDLVKVTSSKGNLEGKAIFEELGNGSQLVKLDLTDDAFANSNIKITVKKVAGGDGFANVGFIDATDNDLGHVTVKGDLGRIVAGDGNEATAALKTLKVQSMGELGTSTQGGILPGGLIPGPILGLLDDLLGSNGVPGLLAEVQSRVSELLNGGIPLTDTLTRTLAVLDTNLAALLDSAGGGQFPGRTLLGNLSGAISDLLNSNDDLDGPFETLLGQTGDLLDEVLGLLPSGLLAGAEVDDLLGLDINALLGLNLGGLPGSAGNVLEDVGETLDNLLGLPGLGNVSPGLQDLLGRAGLQLDAVLDGDVPLTAPLIGLLAELQTTTAGLLGMADTVTGLLTQTAIDLLTDLNDALQGLLGSDGQNDGNFSLSSDIRGDLKALRVTADIRDAFINVDGDIRTVVIGGSVIGDTMNNGGQIFATGSIDSVRIGKNLIGGETLNSGTIMAGEVLKRISVGGAIIGGAGAFSGGITSSGDIASVHIKGNLAGGEGVLSGHILNDNGRIARLVMKGSLVAGGGESSGTIRATDDIKTLNIGGGVVGDDDHRVIVSAAGEETKKGTKNPAFGTISVKGSVGFADFLAGYNTALTGVNGDAQIGNVNVMGSWVASNLVAGAESADSENETFGQASDRKIDVSNSSSIIARIASITIKGAVFGTMGGGDHYGFVAEEIVRASIGGTKVPLQKGANGDVVELAEASGDVTLREVTA